MTLTIQDLKDNKAEILSLINENGNANFTKEIMQAMLNLVNGEMADGTIEELVLEVIDMNDDWKKSYSNSLWGAKDSKYSTQAEYQRACLGGKWSNQYYN
jgi:hypothetical protein